MNKTAGNPEEFFENVKIDLFPDEVYTFTPKGKIMELPSGSTVVDFAYAIHTDIGNTCVGARINRKLVPLGTQLTNGQTVEIITASSGRPNPAWLSFVATAKARSQIRHFLKNLQENEAIALGKRLLNRELESFSLTYQDISKIDMKHLINENKSVNENKLFKDIGLGNKMAPLIARQIVVLKKISLNKKSVSDNTIPLTIKGTEGMVVNFPKCCYPIPGDPIHGFVTSGRGIVIHRQTCKNLVEYQKQQEKWIDVEWEKDNENEYQAKIHLNVNNQRGVLATVAAAIADADANINSVEMKERDDRHTTLRFIIAVRNRGHLAKVIRKIRLIKSVSHIDRK
jgi:(p)ppGpp synthase/HD superfamily hydrolase